MAWHRETGQLPRGDADGGPFGDSLERAVMMATFRSVRRHAISWAAVMMVFAVFGGDPPPMVNEAHYLVKAKNFWDATYCSGDLFASSGKAHVAFYAMFGWPSRSISLEATAWIGRIVGWSLLAAGLVALSNAIFPMRRFAPVVIALVWIAALKLGNLAGEWVVGGIEAKVPAYGFALFGLANLVRRRWNRVWVHLGIASAFHVLTGGWSVVAAMAAWALTEPRRDDRRPLLTRWLCLGGILSLVGLIPALRLMTTADPGDAALAARIYTYYRIRHHLLPIAFEPAWYVRFATLVTATGAAVLAWDRNRVRLDRLVAFVSASLAICLVGLGIGTQAEVWPDAVARLLRFYWFRLADAVVPLLLAVATCGLFLSCSSWRRVVGTLVLFAALKTVADYRAESFELGLPPSLSSPVVSIATDHTPEQNRAAAKDWLAVCDWARTSTPRDAVFLTPRHQQTFKWYADRAEVVNWKDVPQDAVSLREWYVRFLDVFPPRLKSSRVTGKPEGLAELKNRYAAEWMIVDHRVVPRGLPLKQVYPVDGQANSTYAAYELP